MTVSLDKPHRLVINHSLNKSKVVVVGQTPKDSLYCKVTYYMNSQPQYGELFLKKSNGEERTLFFHNTYGQRTSKTVFVEDSKDNKIIKDRIIEIVGVSKKDKSVYENLDKVGRRATLKERVYKANQLFIDKFIKGVTLPKKLPFFKRMHNYLV